MTRHTLNPGTALTDEERATLYQRFVSQRIEPERLLEQLAERRERQLDFVTDHRTLQMVPVPADDPEATPRPLNEIDRATLNTPKVAILPRSAEEEWFRATGPLTVNAHGHGQIAESTPIGKRYYDRMLRERPDLLSVNVNEWWKEKEETRRLVRVEDGHVRAWLSDRYLRVSNLDLAETLIPVLTGAEGGWQIIEAAVTDRRMHIRAIVPTMSTEIRVGDPVQMAITISNSEVGAGRLEVSGGLYRLVCTNLMIAADSGLKRVHLGRQISDSFVHWLSDETQRTQDRALLLEARDVLKQMTRPETFETLTARATSAAATELEDPIAATTVLGKTLSLSDGETHRIQTELTKAGDPSMWGLLNALTASARDLEDYERKAELERSAGALLSGSWKQFKEAAA